MGTPEFCIPPTYGREKRHQRAGVSLLPPSGSGQTARNENGSNPASNYSSSGTSLCQTSSQLAHSGGRSSAGGASPNNRSAPVESTAPDKSHPRKTTSPPQNSDSRTVHIDSSGINPDDYVISEEMASPFEQEIAQTLSQVRAEEGGARPVPDAAPKRKRRMFKRPRRNSKIDRIMRILEDKRIKDESELYQLQDFQMPRLRMVLNVLFVLLGVGFLLAVVVVIIYTNVVK